MTPVKNIIFDLGGVILNIDNRITEREFATLGAIDFGRYFGHGFAASFFKDYEVGKINNEQFVAEIKKLVGNNLSDTAIINSWNALLLDFPPERIALLNRLSQSFRVFYSAIRMPYTWKRFIKSTRTHLKRGTWMFILRKPIIPILSVCENRKRLPTGI